MTDPARRGTRQANYTRSGGLSGAFNPTSLVGTQGGFWRADMGVTLSGSNVTGWADQGSFSHNLSVLGSPAQVSPVFSATGFNTSFPGIDFSGSPSSGLGITSNIFNTTTLSWFMLLSDNNSSGLRFMWDNVTAAGNEFTTPSVELTSSGAATGFNSYSSGIQGNGGAAAPYTSNIPQVFGTIFDGAHANTYLNFSVVGSGSVFSSTLGAAGAGSFGLGLAANANSSIMKVAWVLVTNNVLSGGNLTSLKTWTNSNWGTSF